MKKSVLFVVATAALLAGCAGFSQKTPEEQVRARAEAHQQARLENDYAKAYEFLSPGYRETHSFKAYMRSMGGAVKREGYSVKGVECDDKVCTVAVELSYRYGGLPAGKMGKSAPTMQRTLQEKWLHADGEWWLVPDR